MNKDLGDAVPARATHASHRAEFHRLGLSVGIAIALAGCNSRQAQPEKQADAKRGCPTEGAIYGSLWHTEPSLQGVEITQPEYENLRCVVREFPGVRGIVADKLSDGKIVYSEWRSISAAQSREWMLREERHKRASVEALKRAVAQGIEARQRHDREAGHGRNDESPVADGHAPNPSPLEKMGGIE